MPSLDEIEQLRELLNRLGVLAVDAVIATWERLGPQGIQETYPASVDPFMAAAGTVTAEWYANLVDHPVEQAALTPVEAMQATARWALTQPDPVSSLTSAAERRVFDASRDTVDLNVKLFNEGWVRVANADACAFCRMLATRDNMYTSSRSATRKVTRRG